MVIILSQKYAKIIIIFLVKTHLSASSQPGATVLLKSVTAESVSRKSPRLFDDQARQV